ncbi:MAG TPA: hypothetical protein VFJ16_11785 [Longimicrobium sp.]|nr:hypothetical protein [Longimicrobium sp.]
MINRIRTGRALALAALALAAHAGTARAQQPLPPAKQIVDKYVEAIGGRSLLGRFTARKTVAEMSMPSMGMTMNMEVFQARPNKVFTRMSSQMGTFTGGYDGSVAWSLDPMNGPRVLSGAELNQTLSRSEFDANLDMAASFPTMETVGERTVNGQPCWEVRMVHKTGVEMRNCFDKATGLLVATVSKQHTQMGEVDTEATYTNYQVFDGIKMPTTTTMSMAGQQLVTTIKSVSHEAIADSVFALPAEIKALQH